ncbi:hypothetical protein QBC46DRAFT_257444 [Diplogelasinospora grovesii]|uniref:Tim44-like domain-containing protein n=1 Tax=Diplogelasinospora grovesii TaxID=303347 RepID=A0AAN6NBB4_9PEZI|nr:hypothetical protein QBC46DRAFT_257444 [Diplogelasinospora grovesii]
MPAARQPFSVSAHAARGAQFRAGINRAMTGTRGTSPSPKTETARRQQQTGVEQSSAAVSILLPGTFVRPPLSRFPRGAKPFFRFLYEFLRVKFMDAVQVPIFKYTSKPSLFSRALWKRNNANVVLTAKALHRQMSEALAVGDKTALHKICVSQLLTPLLGTIDARPKGRRYGWELVRYNQSWYYPRIMSHKILAAADPSIPDSPYIRQVVVAIASRQRRVEYDDSPRGGGRVVPGSEKEADLVENVVLTCTINPHTYAQDEWRIFGTVKNTTPDDWETEKLLVENLDKDELEKYKI